ncbi:MAG TPA: hypothetical protein VI409_02780 [Gaiellaceae bacterium]|nr:hypothetical protein [Gaiellaceae bacterium]
MKAPDVLRIALREADLLANTGAPIEQVTPIIRLANKALQAGDGEIPDEEVRSVGMQDGELKQFGLL